MARTTQDRQWIVDGDPFLVDDEETLGQALMEAVTVLTRIGGGLVIAAQREEVAPDMWQTTGFVFRWSSYSPGIRRRQDEEQQVPEQVPEPVEA